jgi:hypothetical protein
MVSKFDHFFGVALSQFEVSRGREMQMVGPAFAAF